jgi:hypothetical protein
MKEFFCFWKNLDLLRTKRNEIQTLKDNYLNGLKQLDYARVAIDAMKKELTELQPKLKETAVIVENLMVGRFVSEIMIGFFLIDSY